MPTALFVGRFQPFHNGHLKVIKDILKQNYKLIIGIGRSQESNTFLNPFSAEERKEMIKLTLEKEGIKDYKIISIPDKPEDEDWLEYIEKTCPKFDVVFTGNPETKDVFENSKYKIMHIEQELKISSTDIRDRIVKNKSWKSQVPEETCNYLIKINAKQRLEQSKSLLSA